MRNEYKNMIIFTQYNKYHKKPKNALITKRKIMDNYNVDVKINRYRNKYSGIYRYELSIF
jgi:hypothetical protein